MKRNHSSEDIRNSKKNYSCENASWIIKALFSQQINEYFSIYGSKFHEPQSIMRKYLQEAGFRVSLISNPRVGISVYTDLDYNSINQGYDGKIAESSQLLWLMLGVHPHQNLYEKTYQTFRNRFVAIQLIARLSNVDTIQNSQIAMDYLTNLNHKAMNIDNETNEFDIENGQQWQHKLLVFLVDEIQSFSHSILLRDINYVHHRNNILSNTLLGIFLIQNNKNNLFIYNITLTPSFLNLKFQRINILFYDEISDYKKPLPFLYKPLPLSLLLHKGLDDVIQLFITDFWNNIKLYGYIAGIELKNSFNPVLIRWVRSGISSSSNHNLPLQACFEPANVPLSLYLHGMPGAGKSSFVRALTAALGTSINILIDPQMEVRLVKFNLNKPLRVLMKELQLRPNNNDLSVMSIIQGRRQTFAQVKRGLVIIALEEVPSSSSSSFETSSVVPEDSITNNGGEDVDVEDEDDIMVQEETLRHLALRFKGIDGDTTLLPFFTSNYPLSSESRRSLSQLKMFNSMTEFELSAVVSEDRIQLYHTILQVSLEKQSKRLLPPSLMGINWTNCDIQDSFFDCSIADSTNNSFGGDNRPIIHKLNALSYFAVLEAKRLLSTSSGGGRCSEVSLSVTRHFDETDQNYMIKFVVRVQDKEPSVSKLCEYQGGVFPSVWNNQSQNAALSDIRAKEFYNHFTSSIPTEASTMNQIQVDEVDYFKLSVIIDLYFNRVLTPAVIVFIGKFELSSTLVRFLCQSSKSHHHQSTNKDKVEGEAVAGWCEGILGVDPLQMNMVRSLYDSRDSRNLRDDILTAKAKSREGNVLIEIINAVPEAQLLLRELVEDSPSLTSFSTASSALYKDGLFFIINLKSQDMLTPEITSRASLVI